MMINYQLTRFYQGLLHTEKVGRLPLIIEFIFNTPSHHRVHHASNPEYIDKNHGGVLIIWDRIFGTFCRENAKPSYGLTEKRAYKNFAAIQFSQWGQFLHKLTSCRSINSIIKCFTGKPGEQALPVNKMPGEKACSMAAGKKLSYNSFSQPVVNTPLHLYI